MLTLTIRSILFIVVVFSLSVKLMASQEGFANTKSVLDIGVSFSIPPWVIQETDSGIELDLLRAALEPAGYKVKPTYLSFALAYSMFDARRLDGVLNAKEGAVSHGYFSQPVVRFQNVAVSLAEKGFPQDIDVSFLQGRSVVAFQNASQLLGDAFKNMAESNFNYQEIAKQRLQINLLMIRDVDFVVMDKSIFGYYWSLAQQDASLAHARSKLARPVTFHYIFEPNDYRFVFKEAGVRDDFDRGLERLRETGGYERILKKYDHLKTLYPEVGQ